MRHIIAASDLDQTLIYSQGALERIHGEGPQSDCSAYKVVEHYEGKPLSHMSKRLCALFISVVRRVVFVPMTTRTLMAYRRVHFPSENEGVAFTPDWAITTNGAVVLRDGEVDAHWTEHLHARLARESVKIEEVEQKFQSDYMGGWVLRMKRAEERFTYCIVERDNVPQAAIESFRLWLKDRGWSLSLQGRKLYFVPHAISKAAALEYVREQVETGAKRPMQLMACGDSLLDLPALDIADHALAPAHGEIFSRYTAGLLKNSVEFTRQSGMQAAEEILKRILEAQ